MDDLPSIKLKRFVDNLGKAAETLYGAGGYGGVKLPTGMALILVFSALTEVMQLNGVYQNRHDLLKATNSIALYGLIFQLIARLVSRLNGNEKKFYPMINILLEFTVKEEKFRAHRAIMDASIKRQVLSVKVYTVLIMILSQIPVYTGFVLSLLKREFIMTFEIYFPYTDPKTLLGYSLGIAMLAPFSVLFSVMFLITDVQVIYFSSMLVPMVDILSLKIEKYAQRFDEFLARKDLEIDAIAGELRATRVQREATRAVAEAEWNKRLETVEGELIELIRDYERYNECIVRISSYVSYSVFSAMYGNAFSIGLALLYARTVSIPMGLPLSALLCFQIFIPCQIGTIVATQNERLRQAFHGFPWYLLSLKKQKIFLQFIHQLQCTNEFKFAIIGVVNMEMFKDMLNASYSFLMYLLKFF